MVRDNPETFADLDGHCSPAQACYDAAASKLEQIRKNSQNASANSSPAAAYAKTLLVGSLTDTAKLLLSPLTMGTATGTCAGGSGCSKTPTAKAVGGDLLKGAAIAGGLLGVAGKVLGATAETAAGASELSTPVGRLGNPMNTTGINTAETINGTDYSGHALDRMQSVGLTPSVVEDTLQNGVPGPGNLPSTATLTTDQLKVVINSDKLVVTVTPQ